MNEIIEQVIILAQIGPQIEFTEILSGSDELFGKI